MTFARLSRGHLVAAVAALLLLLVMAMDWYSTAEGEDARRTEQITGDPSPGVQGELDREVIESSSILAEQNEENAWQASGAIDRVILALLIASVLMAFAAAALRAAGRPSPTALPPSVLAAGSGAVAALLIAVRIVDEGAFEIGGAVKAGAPLGLVAVGALAFAAALAARDEAGREREREQAAPG